MCHGTAVISVTYRSPALTAITNLGYCNAKAFPDMAAVLLAAVVVAAVVVAAVVVAAVVVATVVVAVVVVRAAVVESRLVGALVVVTDTLKSMASLGTAAISLID